MIDAGDVVIDGSLKRQARSPAGRARQLNSFAIVGGNVGKSGNTPWLPRSSIPSEISELIKTRIEKVKLAAEARNEGTVTSVSDGIVRIHGLADVMQGEMIELPNATSRWR